GNLAAMKSIFSTGVEMHSFPDTFESNETQAAAKPVSPNGSLNHATFFRDPDGDGSGGGTTDVDWYSFVAASGTPYTIETLNLLSGCDTLLQVYNSSAVLLASNDNRAAGDPSSLISNFTPGAGTFSIRVSRQGSNIQYGSYDLKISPPPDDDGDGILNPSDNCPTVPNPT